MALSLLGAKYATIVALNTEALRKEFRHYLAHQDEFVAKYDGRVIALKDGVVLGDFDSAGAAMLALQDTHPLGTYLIQRVSPGDKDTTVSIYSPGPITAWPHNQCLADAVRRLPDVHEPPTHLRDFTALWDWSHHLHGLPML